MSGWMRAACAQLALVSFALIYAGSGASAADTAWQVSKASGDVWVTTSGLQQAALDTETVLKPGDNIRTGRSGRVLLTRGDETILISPNSAIGIPTDAKDGLFTTIVQQAGTILLEVEKRNSKHFQVETPYLAAVVKGTQFRVAVNKFGSTVEVLQGRVEVADHKSGKYALVLPGQNATVSSQGKGGLSLSGKGVLSPVQQGQPRNSSVQRLPVPRSGLSAPSGTGGTANGRQVRALGNTSRAALTGQSAGRGVSAGLSSGTQVTAIRGNRALRIGSPLGEVTVNFHKATKGLARSTGSPALSRGNVAKKTTWTANSTGPGNGVGNASGVSSGTGSGNGNGGGNGNRSSSSGGQGNGGGNAGGNPGASAVAHVNGNGNGNGGGNGNGNGNSNGGGNGNGNGNGNGKGNGNGGGNGNGN